jgi:putative hydrolase of HD superfamily
MCYKEDIITKNIYMNTKKIVNFIFEMSQLKRKTSGWILAGISTTNSPSVAEHTLRTAQIGYILAVMENVNPERVASILLIHDNIEARTGDQNKVSARYFDKKNTEELVFNEQIQGLGNIIEKKWLNYFNEFEERNTKEGIVAKDADWLETAFQAKEYSDIGFSVTQDWINNVEKALETESAKKLLAKMKQSNPTDWWKSLKKMTYKKLH